MVPEFRTNVCTTRTEGEGCEGVPSTVPCWTGKLWLKQLELRWLEHSSIHVPDQVRGEVIHFLLLASGASSCYEISTQSTYPKGLSVIHVIHTQDS